MLEGSRKKARIPPGAGSHHKEFFGPLFLKTHVEREVNCYGNSFGLVYCLL